MGGFWWVFGGMVVLVGAVVLRDKSTRHKVIRAMARSWERRSKPKSKAKAKARQHLRARKASVKTLPQARPRYERPKRPKMLATKCSAACRTSRKPAFDKNGQLTCDCPCGGREHGVYRRGSTSGPKVASGAVAGTNGVKKVSTPKPSAPASPTRPAQTPKPAAQKPAATGGVTNINRGGTVGVQDSRGAPGTRVTNINRGGVVGVQAGTVSGATKVQPVSGTKAPTQRSWNSLQVSSWERMKSHAETSPRCAKGTFSAQTIRDRRTDPPKVTQQIKCDTCERAVS